MDGKKDAINACVCENIYISIMKTSYCTRAQTEAKKSWQKRSQISTWKFCTQKSCSLVRLLSAFFTATVNRTKYLYAHKQLEK